MKLNKVFLLFGASGELGKAAAEYFLKKDYSKYYFFTRRDISINREDKDFEIIKTGDLSVEKNVSEAFSKVTKEQGTEYFLFSAIGGFTGGQTIAETAYEDWYRMMDLNLYPAFLIAKYFAQLTGGTKGGSVCFTSALSSLKPEIGKAAYNISKNGLNFLVKTMALEGREIGISANAVAPYIIDTADNRTWVEDKKLLVSTDEICTAVQAAFENWKYTSGNIIELPFSL